MKKYDNIGTECAVTNCQKIQFGEFSTCRLHTSHMKEKASLLEFLNA